MNKEHSELEKAVEILKPVVAACYDLEQTKPKVEAVVDEALRKIEALIQTSNKEARIDEINLFREAMINHSTPMIYAPDRIKQLKQEEAK